MSSVGDTLRSLSGVRDAVLEEQPDAYRTSFSRGAIDVLVTVPKAVLEWFIDVRENVTDLSVNEWLDYAGYDDTSESQLAADMNADIKRIVERLFERPLRLVNNRGTFHTKALLQWQVDGNWEQALPLVVESDEIVEQAAGKS